MRYSTRVLTALAAATALLAGCGGGGSTGNVAPAAVTQPVAAASPTPGAAAVGHGTLRVVFPTNYQRAKIASGKGAAATRRGPAYVSPNGTILDVFVDGVLQYNLDGVTPSDSATISGSNPDGTQTLTLPLYSTGTNDVVAMEWDTPYNNILALGEAQTATFAPGSNVVIGLTMQMNVAYLGIATNTNGNNATTIPAPNPTPMVFYSGCNDPVVNSPTTNTFFLFTADWLGGYVASANGYGGTVTPTISSSLPDATPNSPTVTTYQALYGQYNISYDPSGSGITFQVRLPSNPALDLYDSSSNIQNIFSNYSESFSSFSLTNSAMTDGQILPVDVRPSAC